MKCMKTEVYSWRVSADLKMNLEREAQRRNTSISALLDQAARDLLNKGEVGNDDEEQRRLQEAASQCFGSWSGGDPRGSEKVRETVRQRLREKYGR